MKAAIIALVGRPNVGKSSLFNRLARKQIAIVKDEPGVTRDRNVAFVEYKGFDFTLIDTGGFEPDSDELMPKHIGEQVTLAIEEADGIVFVMDRTVGWSHQDREIFNHLRRSQKPVYFAINKVDGGTHEKDLVDFYESGAENLFPISAKHGRGINNLLEALAEDFPQIISNDEEKEDPYLSVSVVGRPNAGKSSLVNCFLGEDRQIVDSTAGTTRDSIDSYFRYHGQDVRIIDTAGIRKKSRVSQLVDKYSMIAAIKSIERSDVVLLVMDSLEKAVEQDARIGGYIKERGKAAVIVMNKWDLVEKDSNTLEKTREDIRDRLKFLSHCPIVFVSAKTGQRVPTIMDSVLKVYEEYTKRIQTSDVNKILESITMRHQPPRAGHKATKIYFGSQVSIKPPTFVISTNNPEGINLSYKRFMENQFRYHFGYDGTPLHIIWRQRQSQKAVTKETVKRVESKKDKTRKKNTRKQADEPKRR